MRGFRGVRGQAASDASTGPRTVRERSWPRSEAQRPSSNSSNLEDSSREAERPRTPIRSVKLAYSSGKIDCSRCRRSTLSLSSPCNSSSAYVTSSAKYGVNDVSERIAGTGGGRCRSRLCSELQKKTSWRRACSASKRGRGSGAGAGVVAGLEAGAVVGGSVAGAEHWRAGAACCSRGAAGGVAPPRCAGRRPGWSWSATPASRPPPSRRRGRTGCPAAVAAPPRPGAPRSARGRARCGTARPRAAPTRTC